MIIKVSEEHIKTGLTRCCHSCPVALAIREVVRNKYEVIVNGIRLHLYLGGERIFQVDLPEEVRLWIGLFDTREKVQPMEFTLEIEEKYLK